MMQLDCVRSAQRSIACSPRAAICLFPHVATAQSVHAILISSEVGGLATPRILVFGTGSVSAEAALVEADLPACSLALKPHVVIAMEMVSFPASRGSPWPDVSCALFLLFSDASFSVVGFVAGGMASSKVCSFRLLHRESFLLPGYRLSPTFATSVESDGHSVLASCLVGVVHRVTFSCFATTKASPAIRGRGEAPPAPSTTLTPPLVDVVPYSIRVRPFGEMGRVLALQRFDSRTVDFLGAPLLMIAFEHSAVTLDPPLCFVAAAMVTPPKVRTQPTTSPDALPPSGAIEEGPWCVENVPLTSRGAASVASSPAARTCACVINVPWLSSRPRGQKSQSGSGVTSTELVVCLGSDSRLRVFNSKELVASFLLPSNCGEFASLAVPQLLEPTTTATTSNGVAAKIVPVLLFTHSGRVVVAVVSAQAAAERLNLLRVPSLDRLAVNGTNASAPMQVQIICGNPIDLLRSSSSNLLQPWSWWEATVCAGPITEPRGDSDSASAISFLALASNHESAAKQSAAVTLRYQRLAPQWNNASTSASHAHHHHHLGDGPEFVCGVQWRAQLSAGGSGPLANIPAPVPIVAVAASSKNSVSFGESDASSVLLLMDTAGAAVTWRQNSAAFSSAVTPNVAFTTVPALRHATGVASVAIQLLTSASPFPAVLAVVTADATVYLSVATSATLHNFRSIGAAVPLVHASASSAAAATVLRPVQISALPLLSQGDAVHVRASFAVSAVSESGAASFFVVSCVGELDVHDAFAQAGTGANAAASIAGATVVVPTEEADPALPEPPPPSFVLAVRVDDSFTVQPTLRLGCRCFPVFSVLPGPHCGASHCLVFFANGVASFVTIGEQPTVFSTDNHLAPPNAVGFERHAPREAAADGGERSEATLPPSQQQRRLVLRFVGMQLEGTDAAGSALVALEAGRDETERSRLFAQQLEEADALATTVCTAIAARVNTGVDARPVEIAAAFASGVLLVSTIPDENGPDDAASSTTMPTRRVRTTVKPFTAHVSPVSLLAFCGATSPLLLAIDMAGGATLFRFESSATSAAPCLTIAWRRVIAASRVVGVVPTAGSTGTGSDDGLLVVAADGGVVAVCHNKPRQQQQWGEGWAPVFEV